MCFVHLCWCLGVLLVIPSLDARNVKLVPTGTKTITTDGATHEISRYMIVPDDDSNGPSVDNEKILQVIHNTVKNGIIKDSNESKINTKKNRSADAYYVNSEAATKTIKHENIETAKTPDLVKYNLVFKSHPKDNNYKTDHKINDEVLEGLLSVKSDEQGNAKNTKVNIKVTPLHHESKSNVYIDGQNGDGKKEHINQSNAVFKVYQQQTGQTTDTTVSGIPDVNVDSDISEADAELQFQRTADHTSGKSAGDQGDSWHTKTKTIYKPAKITNIRIAGLPLNWDTTSVGESGVHPLLETFGINKTFTLPGKRGRFKLIYEDDDYDDDKTVLERPVILQSTSKHQNRTAYKDYEEFANTIKTIPGDVEKNNASLVLLMIKTNNEDDGTVPILKNTNLDTNTENNSENDAVDKLTLVKSNTIVSPQSGDNTISKTNSSYPHTEVTKSLAKLEKEIVPTLLDTDYSVDKKSNIELKTEASQSATNIKPVTFLDRNEVNVTFPKTAKVTPNTSVNNSIIVSKSISDQQPNLKLTKSSLHIKNNIEEAPPNKYVVNVNSKNVGKNRKKIKPAANRSNKFRIVKTINSTVPSTSIEITSSRSEVKKLNPDTFNVNIQPGSDETIAKNSIVPNAFNDGDEVETEVTVKKTFDQTEAPVSDILILESGYPATSIKPDNQNIETTKLTQSHAIVAPNYLTNKHENLIKTDSGEDKINTKLVSKTNVQASKAGNLPNLHHETTITSEKLPKDNASKSVELGSESQPKSENNINKKLDLSGSDQNNMFLNLPPNKIAPTLHTVTSTNFPSNTNTKSDEMQLTPEETQQLVDEHNFFDINTDSSNKLVLPSSLLPGPNNTVVKISKHNTNKFPTIEKTIETNKTKNNPSVEIEKSHKIQSPLIETIKLIDDNDNIDSNTNPNIKMALPLNLMPDSNSLNVKPSKHNTYELPIKENIFVPNQTKNPEDEHDHFRNDLNPTNKNISPQNLLSEFNDIDVNVQLDKHNSNLLPTKDKINVLDELEKKHRMLPLKETEKFDDHDISKNIIHISDKVIAPLSLIAEYNDTIAKLGHHNTIELPELPTEDNIIAPDQTTKLEEHDNLTNNINPTNKMIPPLNLKPESNVRLGKHNTNALPTKLKVNTPDKINENPMNLEQLEISESKTMTSNEDNYDQDELEVIPQLNTEKYSKEDSYENDDLRSSRITYREEITDSDSRKINLDSKNIQPHNDPIRDQYVYRSAKSGYPLHTYSGYGHTNPYQIFNGYNFQSNDANVADEEYLKYILHNLLSSNRLAELSQQYAAAGQGVDPEAIRMDFIIRYLRSLGINKLRPEQLQFLTQQVHQQETLKKKNHKVELIYDNDDGKSNQNQIIIPTQYVYILPNSNLHPCEKQNSKQSNGYIYDDVNTANGAIADLSARVHNIAVYLRSIGVSEALIYQYVAEVKQYLTPEVIQPVVTECQRRTYASLAERIDAVAKQILQRSTPSEPNQYQYHYPSHYHYY